MKNEISTRISPEGLEVANAYLELGNIQAVCVRLKLDEGECSECEAQDVRRAAGLCGEAARVDHRHALRRGLRKGGAAGATASHCLHPTCARPVLACTRQTRQTDNRQTDRRRSARMTLLPREKRAA